MRIRLWQRSFGKGLLGVCSSDEIQLDCNYPIRSSMRSAGLYISILRAMLSCRFTSYNAMTEHMQSEAYERADFIRHCYTYS